MHDAPHISQRTLIEFPFKTVASARRVVARSAHFTYSHLKPHQLRILDNASSSRGLWTMPGASLLDMEVAPQAVSTSLAGSPASDATALLTDKGLVVLAVSPPHPNSDGKVATEELFQLEVPGATGVAWHPTLPILFAVTPGALYAVHLGAVRRAARQRPGPSRTGCVGLDVRKTHPSHGLCVATPPPFQGVQLHALAVVQVGASVWVALSTQDGGGFVGQWNAQAGGPGGFQLYASLQAPGGRQPASSVGVLSAGSGEEVCVVLGGAGGGMWRTYTVPVSQPTSSRPPLLPPTQLIAIAEYSGHAHGVPAASFVCTPAGCIVQCFGDGHVVVLQLASNAASLARAYFYRLARTSTLSVALPAPGAGAVDITPDGATHLQALAMLQDGLVQLAFSVPEACAVSPPPPSTSAVPAPTQPQDTSLPDGSPAPSEHVSPPTSTPSTPQPAGALTPGQVAAAVQHTVQPMLAHAVHAQRVEHASALQAALADHTARLRSAVQEQLTTTLQPVQATLEALQSQVTELQAAVRGMQESQRATQAEQVASLRGLVAEEVSGAVTAAVPSITTAVGGDVVRQVTSAVQDTVSRCVAESMDRLVDACTMAVSSAASRPPAWHTEALPDQRQGAAQPPLPPAPQPSTGHMFSASTDQPLAHTPPPIGMPPGLPAPAEADLVRQLKQLTATAKVNPGSFETAFVKALESPDPTTVDWFCVYVASVGHAPASVTAHLSPAVQLCLVQQLSFNLSVPLPDIAQHLLPWIVAAKLALDHCTSLPQHVHASRQDVFASLAQRVASLLTSGVALTPHVRQSLHSLQ